MDLLLATSVFHPSPGPSSWGTAGGEIAHAALGLAKGLRAQGHRVTLVAPLAESSGLVDAGLGLARRLSPVSFTFAGKQHERRVFDARLPSGVEVSLLGGDAPQDATDEATAVERWMGFAHATAALALARLGSAREGEADLAGVVAIGELAAPVMLALREDAKLPGREGAPSPRLLAGLARLWAPMQPRQDVLAPHAALGRLGIDPSLFSPEGVEFYGQISLSKCGAIAADRVLTFGEASLASLVAPGASHRLDGVFRARGADLVECGAGIDGAQFNPATDPHLASRFDVADPNGKVLCRSAVVTELELDRQAGLPVLVWMPSLAECEVATGAASALARAARGELLVIAALPAAAESSAVATLLQRAQAAHPGRIVCKTGLAERGLHRLLGGADFVLSLDADGATGVTVRAAQRYGALPVAFASPGALDAIVDAPSSLETGTGFLFAGLDEHAVYGGIARAISAFQLPGFASLRRRVMRKPHGWERASHRIASIVTQLQA
jgi:hypothetical protein